MSKRLSIWLKLSLLILGFLSFASPSFADIVGFDNSQWTVNSGSSTTPASVGSGTAILTWSEQGDGQSIYYNQQQAVGNGFTVSFTYTASNFGGDFGGLPADGFTFVIQGGALTALGGSGSDLGYAGIQNSASVQFNLWQFNGGGIGTGYFTNGDVAPSVNALYTPTTPVNLASANPIAITLVYDAVLHTLTESLQDTATTDTFSHVFTGVDIGQAVGGNLAYVGFTGGTGGNFATQVLGDLSFTSTAATVPEPSSVTLVGLGGMGLVVNALRRRRAAI